MLGWAITFFIIAIVAAALGFGGIAGSAVSIAQILFVIFLILFLISLVWHLVSGRRPPPVEHRRAIPRDLQRLRMLQHRRATRTRYPVHPQLSKIGHAAIGNTVGKRPGSRSSPRTRQVRRRKTPGTSEPIIDTLT